MKNRSNTLARPERNIKNTTRMGSTFKNTTFSNNNSTNNKSIYTHSNSNRNNGQFNVSSNSNTSTIGTPIFKRPRRCTNCRKMIAANQDYNNHIEKCGNTVITYKKQTNDQIKSRQINPIIQQIPLKQSEYQIQSPSQVQKSQNFRIKRINKVNNINIGLNKNNMPISNTILDHENQTILKQKSQQYQQTKNKEKTQSFLQNSLKKHQISQTQNKILKNTQQLYKKQQQYQSQSQNPQLSHVEQIQQIRELMHQESHQQLLQHSINITSISNNPHIISQNQQQLINRNIPHQNQQLINQDRNQQNNNQQQYPRNQIQNNQQQILQQQQPNQQQIPNNHLRPLIINTSQIQSLINRSFLRQNQIIQTMIQQLRHLNFIANQVQQITLLGAHTQMGQVFSRRIRELQTSLISQIGQTIIRNLQNNYTISALIFTFSSPLEVISQQAQGFSEEDIKKNFEIKIHDQSYELGCSICLNDIAIREQKIGLICKHEFHANCLIQWLKKKPNCPICRTYQRQKKQIIAEEVSQ